MQSIYLQSFKLFHKENRKKQGFEYYTASWIPCKVQFIRWLLIGQLEKAYWIPPYQQTPNVQSKFLHLNNDEVRAFARDRDWHYLHRCARECAIPRMRHSQKFHHSIPRNTVVLSVDTRRPCGLARTACAFRRNTFSLDVILWEEIVFRVEHVAQIDLCFWSYVGTDVCMNVVYFWYAFSIATDNKMDKNPKQDRIPYLQKWKNEKWVKNDKIYMNINLK